MRWCVCVVKERPRKMCGIANEVLLALLSHPFHGIDISIHSATHIEEVQLKLSSQYCHSRSILKRFLRMHVAVPFHSPE